MLQPDFSIQLNDIPLLKKFSSPSNLKNLVQPFRIFDGTSFLLTMRENGAEICPFSKSNEQCFETAEYNLLKKFITYQLIHSGILPFLREIPMSSNDPEYYYSFFIIITVLPENNPDAEEYHNDNYLFQILRYETYDETPVLGSNILFIDQRIAPGHQYMGTGFTDIDWRYMWDDDILKLQSDGQYDVSYAGESLSNTQNQILEMYDTDDLKPVLMRGLYNSGDTLVMNDMLVKHASLSEENNSTIKLLRMSSDEPKEIQVTICKTRMVPTVEDLRNRGLVGISIRKKKIYSDTEFRRLDDKAFTIFDKSRQTLHSRSRRLSAAVRQRVAQARRRYTRARRQRVPNVLNFNIDDYSNFLKTLEINNNMCGSFDIVNNEISQSFHNRGGNVRI